ncbi:YqeG family HAD IIIA-type phosphatase [Chamaesiphon minutus]|uniref:HAD phosphatase subfamily IIIA n=1 Tax=Chamaesiphon minutus (strain ATCC 27169 / PCC 6605) TaxID=1173020 RepID=K9UAP3_CHAP6|nr:YqeG family HAD IIIA-type phosphatase [Chamaesiphon minutus]AFY91698.1 HAD phosphatase subfamily IIIA [Chamaesiphon minutus PCC 6605]
MNKISPDSYLPNFFQQNAREHSLPKRAKILASVSLGRLMDSAIQGIIIALDNTIVSEDDRYISPYAVTWINLAKQLGFKIFILSNGKHTYRVKFWSNRLDIPAIHSARKPFPTAFRRALRHMQLPPERVVVIGDSYHTDILGAWIAGCHSIQVASLPHRPKLWEKLIGRYVQTTYPRGQELWEFKSSNY